MSELPDLELADRASSQWSLDWPKVEPACAEGEEGGEDAHRVPAPLRRTRSWPWPDHQRARRSSLDQSFAFRGQGGGRSWTPNYGPQGLEARSRRNSRRLRGPLTWLEA